MDLDKLVVQEGVIIEKIPEKVIPPSETVIDQAALRVTRAGLVSHIEDLQASVDNDLAQLADMRAKVEKIDAVLKQVPEPMVIEEANVLG